MLIITIDSMKPAEARNHYLAEIESQLHPNPPNKVSGKHGLRAMLRAVPYYPVCDFNEPDEAVLVWSDLHLGHDNIIEYCNRPFLDVDDMNGILWEYLGAALTPDKVLVVVGDLAMGQAVGESTWQALRSLICRQRHLVLGNHDLTRVGTLRAEGFDRVWSVMLSGGEPPLIWTHYPLSQVPSGYVNLHGHIHDDPPTRTPHINVSVEQLDYAPVSLARLRPLARALANGEYPPGETTLERLEAIGQTVREYC